MRNTPAPPKPPKVLIRHQDRLPMCHRVQAAVQDASASSKRGLFRGASGSGWGVEVLLNPIQEIWFTCSNEELNCDRASFIMFHLLSHECITLKWLVLKREYGYIYAVVTTLNVNIENMGYMIYPLWVLHQFAFFDDHLRRIRAAVKSTSKQNKNKVFEVFTSLEYCVVGVPLWRGKVRSW